MYMHILYNEVIRIDRVRQGIQLLPCTRHSGAVSAVIWNWGRNGAYLSPAQCHCTIQSWSRLSKLSSLNIPVLIMMAVWPLTNYHQCSVPTHKVKQWRSMCSTIAGGSQTGSSICPYYHHSLWNGNTHRHVWHYVQTGGGEAGCPEVSRVCLKGGTGALWGSDSQLATTAASLHTCMYV